MSRTALDADCLAVGSDLDMADEDAKIRDYFEKRRNNKSARNMADAAERERAAKEHGERQGAILDSAIGKHG